MPACGIVRQICVEGTNNTFNNITRYSNSHYRKTYIQVYNVDLNVYSNDELLVLNLKNSFL